MFGKKKENNCPAPSGLKLEPIVGELYAPCAGKVVEQDDLSDEIFKSGILGTCVGIYPAVTGKLVLYAPIDGKISSCAATAHALAISSKQGLELLLHAGVDTVELEGEGFELYVHEGQLIRAGQALLSFNVALVQQKSFDPTVIVALTNSSELREYKQLAFSQVNSGDRLFSFC